MTSVEQADAWIGRIGLDSSGRKIGKVTRVWIDDYSGLPTWASLLSGCFDRREAVAPLLDVTATGGRPQFTCTKAEVLSAPRVDDDGHLGLDDEWRLISHYNLAEAPDPTRHPAGALPGAMPRMTPSNRTRLGLRPVPVTANSDSAAESSDRRVQQSALSERLLPPSMRRRLGLG